MFLAALASPLVLVPLPAPPSQEAPPGLVLVEGGLTTIGSRVADVEPLAALREELASALASETPQHRVRVDDFFLMPTEVTNEQYATYVLATGTRPPHSWAAQALDAGRVAFLEEQRRTIEDAKARNLPFQRTSFDPDAWWERNWREVEWEIPQEELAHPVVFVSHADAEGYARWAGLRLMSELEFQRAARGDGEHIYPWGNDWDNRGFCQSLHSGQDQTLAVGSFPSGASNGIFDLAGNVWEWTSSSYTAYPGYRPLRIAGRGNRVIEGLAVFDAEQLVAVGGSYQSDKIGLRLTTRRSTARDTATNGLGFRCAASSVNGLDAARFAVERDLSPGVLPPGVRLHPEATAVLQRWSSLPGTAGAPGYAVITRHEQVFFCPVESLPASIAGELERATRENGPTFLGLLGFSVPPTAPEVDAGTYLVAWRGAGPLAKPARAQPVGSQSRGQELGSPAAERAPAYYEAHGFDAEKDCYLFYDLSGVPQVALPAPRVVLERMKPSRLALEPHVEPAPGEPVESGPPPTDTLRLTIAIPSASSRSKAFFFDLPLHFRPGAIDARWK